MTLLDVQWDDALEADLDRLLSVMRLAPYTPNDGMHSLADAARDERALRAQTIQRIFLLMDRRRAPALDCGIIDAVARLQEAASVS